MFRVILFVHKNWTQLVDTIKRERHKAFLVVIGETKTLSLSFNMISTKNVPF